MTLNTAKHVICRLTEKQKELDLNLKVLTAQYRSNMRMLKQYQTYFGENITNTERETAATNNLMLTHENMLFNVATEETCNGHFTKHSNSDIALTSGSVYPAFITDVTVTKTDTSSHKKSVSTSIVSSTNRPTVVQQTDTSCHKKSVSTHIVSSTNQPTVGQQNRSTLSSAKENNPSVFREKSNEQSLVMVSPIGREKQTLSLTSSSDVTSTLVASSSGQHNLLNILALIKQDQSVYPIHGLSSALTDRSNRKQTVVPFTMVSHAPLSVSSCTQTNVSLNNQQNTFLTPAASNSKTSFSPVNQHDLTPVINDLNMSKVQNISSAANTLITSTILSTEQKYPAISMASFGEQQKNIYVYCKTFDGTRPIALIKVPTVTSNPTSTVLLTEQDDDACILDGGTTANFSSVEKQICNISSAVCTSLDSTTKQISCGTSKMNNPSALIITHSAASNLMSSTVLPGKLQNLSSVIDEQLTSIDHQSPNLSVTSPIISSRKEQNLSSVTDQQLTSIEHQSPNLSLTSPIIFSRKEQNLSSVTDQQLTSIEHQSPNLSLTSPIIFSRKEQDLSSVIDEQLTSIEHQSPNLSVTSPIISSRKDQDLSSMTTINEFFLRNTNKTTDVIPNFAEENKNIRENSDETISSENTTNNESTKQTSNIYDTLKMFKESFNFSLKKLREREFNLSGEELCVNNLGGGSVETKVEDCNSEKTFSDKESIKRKDLLKLLSSDKKYLEKFDPNSHSTKQPFTVPYNLQHGGEVDEERVKNIIYEKLDDREELVADNNSAVLNTRNCASLINDGCISRINEGIKESDFGFDEKLLKSRQSDDKASVELLLSDKANNNDKDQNMLFKKHSVKISDEGNVIPTPKRIPSRRHSGLLSILSGISIKTPLENLILETHKIASQSVGDKVSQSQSVGDKVSQSRSVGDKVSQSQSVGDKVSQSQSVGDKVSQSQSVCDKVSQSQSVGDKVSQSQSVGDRVSQSDYENNTIDLLSSVKPKKSVTFTLDRKETNLRSTNIRENVELNWLDTMKTKNKTDSVYDRNRHNLNGTKSIRFIDGVPVVTSFDEGWFTSNIRVEQVSVCHVYSCFQSKLSIYLFIYLVI